MATEQEKYLGRKYAAVQYLNENEVPKCFQKLLNDVVVERPDDIFGYMAEYFGNHAKPPTLANITSSKVLGSRGYSSFQVEIQALVHGKIKTLLTSNAPFDNKPVTETKPIGKGKSPESKLSMAERLESPERDEDEIQSIVDGIHTCIKPALIGAELYDQQEIDRILEDVIEKRSTANKAVSSTACISQEVSIETVEKTVKNDEALPNDETEPEQESSPDSCPVHLDILTVSMALLQSASHLRNEQLYCYLYKAVHDQEPSSLTLPTPMLTMLKSDKRTAGKLYMLKDVMIFMKKDMPSMQAFKQLTEIYQQLQLIVQQKPTSNMTADSGAFTPALDKPEQALDLLRDAISAAGYSHEDEVTVALNFATKDIYDKDKQKYEISLNAFKSCDDLVNIYVDLCERYPEIEMLIDPFLSHDREGYAKLNERLSRNCFMINQESFSNSPNVLGKVLKEGVVSGSVMKMENASTVTQFLERVKAMEDCPRMLFMSPNGVETYEHLMVDMAVAVQADFIIFGGPGRSENIMKYNRLQKIEHDLNILNILVQKQPLIPHKSTSIDGTAMEPEEGDPVTL